MPQSQHPHSGKTAAQRSLLRVERALRACDEGHPARLDEGDSALERNIVRLVLRHRSQLESLAKSLATGRIRPRVRRILCWAFAEILWCDGLPHPIITAVAVEHLKKRYSQGDAKFANALLRTFLEKDPQQLLQESTANSPAWVNHNLPEDLWHRWRREYGKEATEEIAKVLALPDEVFVRARAPQEIQKSEILEAIPAPEWAAGQQLFRCRDTQALLQSEAWKQEQFYIQDPATLLACQATAVQPGETIADLCSAPGGKSLVLAEQLQGKGKLYCCDRSERRLERVRENLNAHLETTEFLVGDASESVLPPASCDAVLLDVPCSNTGVIRRRPDVRWTFSPEKLHELTILQAEILKASTLLVRPGGRLVYSTCSIEPEENRCQVEAFCQEHPEFSLEFEQQLLPAELHDGAYVARLRHKK